MRKGNTRRKGLINEEQEVENQPERAILYEMFSSLTVDYVYLGT